MLHKERHGRLSRDRRVESLEEAGEDATEASKKRVRRGIERLFDVCILL